MCLSLYCPQPPPCLVAALISGILHQRWSLKAWRNGVNFGPRQKWVEAEWVWVKAEGGLLEVTGDHG